MLDAVQDEIYIDLPSNVRTYNSTGLINKPNHYRTILPQALEFADPSQWEVALVGINFAQTFNTSVTIDNCSFTFQERRSNVYFLEWMKAENKLAKLQPSQRRFHLLNNVILRYEREIAKQTVCKSQTENNKTFSDIEQLINWLNERKPASMKGKFSLNEEKRVVIELRRHEVIKFSPTLANALGFDRETVSGEDGLATRKCWYEEYIDPEEVRNSMYRDETFHKCQEELFQALMQEYRRNERIKDEDDTPEDQSSRETSEKISADYLSDLRINCYNIYCYTNLVRNSIVGDVEVPLLRAIAIDGAHDGKNIGKSFDRLQYRPISSNFFEYIEIKLTDDTGKDLHFNSGKVICTLSLRRRKKRY